MGSFVITRSAGGCAAGVVVELSYPGGFIWSFRELSRPQCEWGIATVISYQRCLGKTTDINWAFMSFIEQDTGCMLEIFLMVLPPELTETLLDISCISIIATF